MDKQIEKFEFRVIDNNTGEEADIGEIALTEDWAKGLIYCDMEGFAILEDGSLVLLDECGGCAYCPSGRFSIIPEGVVVLTMEEFETLKNGHKPLQKLIEELRVQNDFLESEYSSQFWDGVKEGKNKTIIGFQEMFLNEYGAFEDGDKITLLELRRHFDEICKELEGEK